MDARRRPTTRHRGASERRQGPVWTRGALVALAVGLGPRPALANPCPAGQRQAEHQVVSGETFSGIAAQYKLSLRELEGLNPGVTPNLIRPGQAIVICTSAKAGKPDTKPSGDKTCGKAGKLFIHEVAKGDTLAQIAQDYGVEVKAIVARNKALADNPNALRVGAKLEICAEPLATRKSPLCNHETPLWIHEVIPGEHVSDIAGRYGIRRKDLLRLNPSLKANPNLIRPGDKLKVCPDIAPRERERITHVVSKGENLTAIAAKYDLTVRELASFQKGKFDPKGTLAVGTELIVWREGGIAPGFGGVEYSDDSGVLPQGVQLASGKGYFVKAPGNAWGTAKTIQTLQRAIAAYKRKVPDGPKIHIGDISRRGGGPFPPHKSHQHGRDVDIGYVLTGELADVPRFQVATAKNLDARRTWAFVKALIDTDEVRYIFIDYAIQKLLYEQARSEGMSEDALAEIFQYPRSPKRSAGIIRHWKGHANHMHVRFHK